MRITALSQDLTADLLTLMNLGAPYVRARTPSDYWLYARLFSSTCPVALLDGAVVNLMPEHDDCASAAAATGRPVKQIWAEALAMATTGSSEELDDLAR